MKYYPRQTTENVGETDINSKVIAPYSHKSRGQASCITCMQGQKYMVTGGQFLSPLTLSSLVRVTRYLLQMNGPINGQQFRQNPWI